MKTSELVSPETERGIANAPKTAIRSRLFRSFWLGGFESACHINSQGRRLDMIAAVQHDQRAALDYALLRSVGIYATRDTVRWHLVDQGGKYDFSSFAPMLQAAQSEGIQVIWNLMHYGWPDDVDLFSPAFPDRFARFCSAVARFVKDQSDDIPFYTPVNEISFAAWAASRKIMYPFALGQDEEIKRQLVRAWIAGSEAIWAVEPRARLVCAEPLIHVVPARDREDLTRAVQIERESQFEALYMLIGDAQPKLGGNPRYLDVVGVNYYSTNQWERPHAQFRWLPKFRDDRWHPLDQLLSDVYQRFSRPLLVAETSHYGIGRAAWFREVASELTSAISHGIPVEGACLYPILDRHDWDNPNHWHNSGLWDLWKDERGQFQRVLNQQYAAELQAIQHHLK